MRIAPTGSRLARGPSEHTRSPGRAGKTSGYGERAVAARRLFAGPYLPWWIGGVLLGVVIVVIGTNMVVREPTPAAEGGAGGGSGVVGGQPMLGVPPDISSMTPIEAADRLFNRVMMAVANGDSAEAQRFLPMAIPAYERARPLNADGLFHLSHLQRTAGLLEEALATAQDLLADAPDHLLGLYAAAEAARELGREAEAKALYERLKDVYEAEMAAPRQEYLEHQALTETLYDEAEAYLEGRPPLVRQP